MKIISAEVIQCKGSIDAKYYYALRLNCTPYSEFGNSSILLQTPASYYIGDTQMLILLRNIAKLINKFLIKR